MNFIHNSLAILSLLRRLQQNTKFYRNMRRNKQRTFRGNLLPKTTIDRRYKSLRRPMNTIFNSTGIRTPYARAILSAITILQIITLYSGSTRLVIYRYGIIARMGGALFNRFLTIGVSIFYGVRNHRNLFERTKVVGLQTLILPGRDRKLLLQNAADR